MKILTMLRALTSAGHALRPHDVNLRAGNFRKPPIFTPWTMLVS